MAHLSRLYMIVLSIMTICLLSTIVVITLEEKASHLKNLFSLMGNGDSLKSHDTIPKDNRSFVDTIAYRTENEQETFNTGVPLQQRNYARKLQSGLVKGHELPELLSIPTSKQISTQRQAPVTVILLLRNHYDLKQQMESLLDQTVTPQKIWIFCSLADEPYAHLWTASNVEVMILQSKSNVATWLAASMRAPTEYLLVVEDGAVPGQRYLEVLLSVADTVEYSNSLLGTAGVRLPHADEKEDFLCLPSGTTRAHARTQHVDILISAWLLKTEWAGLLMKDIYKTQHIPLNRYISGSLWYQADIPTILIPTYSTNNMGWADTRDPSQMLDICSTLKKEYTSNDSWQRLAKFTDSITQNKAITKISKNVLFFIDGIRQAEALYPLFCSLVNKASIHVIVTGKRRGLSHLDLSNVIMRSQFTTCAGKINIYDLDIQEGINQVHNTINVLAQVSQSTERLLEFIKPRLIFHVTHPTNPALRGIVAAAGNFKGTIIAMPLEEFAYISWIADLEISALERWHEPHVNLVIITNNRPRSLSRLVQSLTNAYYFGDRATLTVNMEQSADRVTIEYMNALEWQHGEKNLRHRIHKGGLVRQIVESWYPSSDNDYAVLLEDDIEVSPFYYSWLKYNLLKYRYSDDNEDTSRLFGISLYGQKVSELKPGGREPFIPKIKLAGYPSHVPYLLPVPCSWGALYFPEHWREYHEYIIPRLFDIEINVRFQYDIPQARSNRWRSSWKKFMLELVYMRAYVMIYPNYDNYTSFSTNHVEMGSHIGKPPRPAVVEQFEVPLMIRDDVTSGLPNNRLPAYSELPVLNIHSVLSNIETLIEEGNAMWLNMSACGDMRTDPFDPVTLLCLYPKHWDRTVEKPKPNTEDKSAVPLNLNSSSTDTVSSTKTGIPAPIESGPGIQVDISDRESGKKRN